MATLFIDIGMTLLGGPDESPSTFICNLLGIPLERKRTISEVVFCRDVSSPKELVESLRAELGLAINESQELKIQQLWDSQVEMCRPLKGAKEFCDELISLGINYYIVSNLWPPFYKALKIHLNDFVENASGVFLSYKIGNCKPSDGFYSSVYSSVSAKPEDIVMVGDSMHNDMQPCISRGSTGILISIGNNPRACSRTSLKNLIRVKDYDKCLTSIKKIHKG